MKIRMTRWCFRCGYVEDMGVLSANRPLVVSFSLEAEDNLICVKCHEKAIRLDISEVVDTTDRAIRAEALHGSNR